MPKKTQLQVKVVPSSSRDALGEWLGETLKIKVQAPPEKGKANRSVIKNLAKWLRVPQDAITLIHGETSPQKVLAIAGLERSEVLAKIEAARD